MQAKLKGKLRDWYLANHRPLPWRTSRDPYRVWISEVMLQQTTSQAVIPYYQKFIQRFPKLHDLASSPLEIVFEHWAGLGYYSRARNLHRAAQELNDRGGFPEDYRALMELPGFGPYTARAVASIAFDQGVGVLDGNVIRVISRFDDDACEWWKPRERDRLQARADAIVEGLPSHQMNQALMELGATICTPQSPKCFLCPVRSGCLAYQNDTIAERPQRRPRRERELWLWEPSLVVKNQTLAFVANDYAPFLKGQLLLPGKVTRLKAKPKAYDFRHSITHHDIFVTVPKKISNMKVLGEKAATWVQLQVLAQKIPLAIIKKTWAAYLQHAGSSVSD